MNFQNLNFDYVEPLQRPNPQYYLGLPRTPLNQSQVTVLPIGSGEAGGSRGGHPDDASIQPASPSSRPTVIPYAPTPPSKSTSDAEIYGPDRLFGPPLVPRPRNNSYAPRAPPMMAETNPADPRHELANIALRAIYEQAWDAEHTSYKDALVREAEVITPGIDDTPYIQAALEALTTEAPQSRYSLYPSSSSDESNPVYHHVPDQGLGYYQPPAQRQRVHLTQPAPVELRRSRGLYPGVPELEGDIPEQKEVDVEVPEPQLSPETPIIRRPIAFIPSSRARSPGRQPHRLRPLPDWDTQTPGSSLSSLVPQFTPRLPVMKKRIMSNEWEALDVDGIRYQTSLERTDGYGHLHFKPRLLRPASLGALMSLCLIMIVALVLCAVFSQLRRGLVPFESMYGGLYFVFRILPQLLACVILMYAQCTITVMYRLLPFVHLHSDVQEERHSAIFEDLYPKSFLWPQLIGPWQLRLAIVATWLANLTLPLQSAAFTVVLADGRWRWAAVQGVLWTLMALYLLLLVSMGILLAYWSRRTKTGLLWDARSLADIMALVTSTNVAPDYKGTDKLGSRDRIKWTLRRRVYDRLGYWGWRNHRPGFWYAMGTSMTDENYLPREEPTDPEKARAASGEDEEGRDSHVAFKVEAMDLQAERDLEASVHSPGVRYRYLPWCLRNNQLLYFVTTALVLFVALLVISFLPSTRIVDGFVPLLPAGPDKGAFSPANFLYTFLPSLLGLIMFLLFSSLDQSVRILQPWAALADRRKGASTKESLLADYAACLPLERSVHAARNGHWRVALVSTLATLFVLIPALAGGLFMAMTTHSGEVRMFANVPLFGVVLALLFLYVVGLAIMLPRRRPFRLPHGATCLAEIISFLANDDLLADPAFKRVRSRFELLGKLGMGREPRDQPRWVFGVGGGGLGSELSLGVRRMRKFTEKRMAQRLARRTGGSRRLGKRASDLRLRMP